MRTSSRKTTAAVLRDIIGIKVPEWSEILKISKHSVHDLESPGRLKLSARLAQKMNYETGISIKWLMDGDPAAPPVAADGREYTKAIYDNVRARQEYFATVKGDDVKNTVLDVLRDICAILLNANRKRNYHMAVYRTAKALAELRDEFGKAKDFDGPDGHQEVVRWVLDQPHWWSFVVAYGRNLQETLRMTAPQIRDHAPTEQPTSKRKSKQPSKKRRR